MAILQTQQLKFQPKARIIRTIGDQLISNPESAVIELVKNAYDADANSVIVKFYPPTAVDGGRISVADDGHGMSVDDIVGKWMEPATSSKIKHRLSASKRRQMMGSKGIGRFAAAKLGSSMSLISVVDTNSGRQAVLIPEIDWSVFNDDVYLSDISIAYETQATTNPLGTIIEIRGLSEKWNQEKLAKLYTELRRLISPLKTSEDLEHEFRIYLDLSALTLETAGFNGVEIVNGSIPAEEDGPELSECHRVHAYPLLVACDYELKGDFASDGKFTGTFRIRRAGRGEEAIELSVPPGEENESPGCFSVHLFLFDRETDAIKNNMMAAGMGQLSASEARRILDNITGVAIYRDGFRIRPYGNPENDWLALDSRRVQDPSLRIGHNQVAGYVTIEGQESSNLVERSSREGFEENASFSRLTDLVTELLAKVVEPRRYKFRSETGLSRRRSTTFDEVRELSELKKVRKLVAFLEPTEREKAEQIIDQQSAQLSDRIDELQERQRILEAKSSLGAHEGGPNAAYVAQAAGRLYKSLSYLEMAKKADVDRLHEDFRKKLPLLANAGEALEDLFRNLRPLAGGKRGKPGYFDPVGVIHRARELFERHGIPIEITRAGKLTELIGYSDDLSTAIINLIGNAIYWLEDSKTADPLINISISLPDNTARILVKDNGPGVPTEFAEQVFDVGFSLKKDGTGLGLNIAREALARSGGSLLFHMDSDDGAAFEIHFPARKPE